MLKKHVIMHKNIIFVNFYKFYNEIKFKYQQITKNLFIQN